MPAPTPKNDWLAKTRIANAEARERKPAPAPEKVAIARKALATVTNAVINAPSPVINEAKSKNADKQAKWRKANPEIHRERSRASMRKLRDKAT